MPVFLAEVVFKIETLFGKSIESEKKGIHFRDIENRRRDQLPLRSTCRKKSSAIRRKSKRRMLACQAGNQSG
jgi:hypothetical protein